MDTTKPGFRPEDVLEPSDLEALEKARHDLAITGEAAVRVTPEGKVEHMIVDEARDIEQALRAAGHEVAVKRAVKDDTTMTDQAAAEERPKTLNEARFHICQTVQDILEESIKATQLELDVAKAAGVDGPAEQTGRNIVTAAKELWATLQQVKKKFADRPRILQPDRARGKLIR